MSYCKCSTEMNPVINEIKEIYDRSPYTSNSRSLISILLETSYYTTDDVINKFMNINSSIFNCTDNCIITDEIYFFDNCIVIIGEPEIKRIYIFMFRNNELFWEGIQFKRQSTTYYKLKELTDYVQI